MVLNRAKYKQDGFGLPDAILAILITGLLISSSFYFLGKTPSSITQRLKEHQDILRFSGFWRASRDAMAQLQPYWWTDGLIGEIHDGSLEIRESDVENARYLRIERTGDTEVLLETQDQKRSYQFQEIPEWRLAMGQSGNIVGLEFIYKSELSVFIGAGAKELRSIPKANNQ